MESRRNELMDLVRTARRAGAAGAELLHVAWEGRSVRLERGGRTRMDRSGGEELTVRCWLGGGRQGEARGPLSAGEALIDQALLAAAAAEDSDVAGPVDRLASIPRGLGIDDRRYDHIEEEHPTEVLVAAERAARQVDRRVLPGAFWYEDRRTRRTFANSKGIGLEERGTVFRAGCSLSLVGNPWTVRRTIDARSFSTIASLPFGTAAAREAVAVAPHGKTLSGPVRVLLEPEATAALIAALGEGFTQAALTGDGFFLGPDPEGGRGVDARLHLLDDGTIPGALRTSGFDDRGVAPVPLTLLREGRVDGRFIGVRRARELGTRPTGHQVDGRLQPRNLVLRSGSRSINVLLNEATEPILVVHSLGDLSGLDLATGEFRCPVGGTVTLHNEPVGGMSDAILEGNLLEVLNAVVEVASNTDRIGHVDAPALLLDGFSLA